MAAYMIAEVDVTDAEAFKAYGALVPATLAKHGGRFLARGGQTISLEGAAPKRIVVIEFKDSAAAKRWYDSTEYAGPKEMRLRCAKSRLLIVEGVPPA